MYVLTRRTMVGIRRCVRLLCLLYKVRTTTTFPYGESEATARAGGASEAGVCISYGLTVVYGALSRALAAPASTERPKLSEGRAIESQSQESRALNRKRAFCFRQASHRVFNNVLTSAGKKIE